MTISFNFVQIFGNVAKRPIFVKTNKTPLLQYCQTEHFSVLIRNQCNVTRFVITPSVAKLTILFLISKKLLKCCQFDYFRNTKKKHHISTVTNDFSNFARVFCNVNASFSQKCNHFCENEQNIISTVLPN